MTITQTNPQKLEDIMVGQYSLAKWQKIFKAEITKRQHDCDPAHRVDHYQRVSRSALKIARAENAELAVIIPAAWLHDMIAIAKDSPLRPQASSISSDAAHKYLADLGYPAQYLDNICHSIAAHSYSANIEAKTLEAKVLQDADRLDAMGAIGLLRCFSCGGSMNRTLYHVDDPFAEQRVVDDNEYSIDHIYAKLLLIADTMQTTTARKIAQQRKEFMEAFLAQLALEL